MSCTTITADVLIERYEVLLLDAYGVLVHAHGSYPGAGDFIATLNRLRKPYFILTNDAASLPEKAAQKYRRDGLDIAPDRVISAGSLLKNYFIENQLIGAPCAVLGTVDSRRYVEIAGGRVLSLEKIRDERIKVVVIGDETGFPFLETVDGVLNGLFHALDAGEPVHLVLPNPDLIYPHDRRTFGIAAGSLAVIYETILQQRYPERSDLRFARLGKPHPAMFAEAWRRSGTRHMVMIGDQLATDIAGANGFGLDSALVTTGVTPASWDAVDGRARPTYLLNSLAVGSGHNPA